MVAWLFTSVTGDRSYDSIDPYEDVLGSSYVYDDSVSYHKQVSKGHVVVLREDDSILGVSRIDEIASSPGVKSRRRCVNCQRAGVEFRKRTNDYACPHNGCKHRSPTALSTDDPITRYVAEYQARWQALDGALTLAQVEPHLLDQSVQNSIRPIDDDGLEHLLSSLSVSIPQSKTPVHVPIHGGRRQTQVLARINQGQFRTGLLRAYGLSCAVTGPCPAEALEAAHILPYATNESHNLEHGLLLRTDIHRLFDAGHIAINPDTMLVEIDPNLAQYQPYSSLSGHKITQMPSVEALRIRYAPTADGASSG